MGTNTQKSRWARRWTRVTVAAALLAGASIVSTSFADAPEAEAWSGPSLAVTLTGNRNDNQPLDGATIEVGDEVGISIAPRLHPALKVEFYLNGRKVRTERAAPWDMSGTGPFASINTISALDLPEGTNKVEARISGYWWRNTTLKAEFTRAPIDSTTAPGLGLDFSSTERLLDGYVRDRGLNGAGLVVVHRDQGIVHESYLGEIDEDRISMLGSTNKIISAGVLLHLADTSPNFNMDDPLSAVVPWAGDLANVTTSQLLSNSSGLPGLPVGYLAGGLCALNVHTTLQRCGESIANNKLDDFDTIAPDSEFRYGGPQWQVAGAVAEVVGERSWEQLLNDIYIEPCGLDVLGFTNFGQDGIFTGVDFPYPGGFDGDVNNLVPTANPIIEGGGYTTPHDYAKLLLMFLRDGKCGDTQVLSEESITLMTTDRIGPTYGGEDKGRGYGLGWFIDGDVVTDPGVFGALSWIDFDDDFAAYFVVEDSNLFGEGATPELIDAVDVAMRNSRLG